MRYWDLVLICEGEGRSELAALFDKLGLADHVRLPGFKQYDELPKHYGLAKALVHASTNQQWGLVVNKAMACGPPVVISNRCGCVPHLLTPGNGYQFEPHSYSELLRILINLTEMSQPDRMRMGYASQALINQWGPDRFAERFLAAARKAADHPVKRQSRGASLLLRLLNYARS